ncbi:MAG: type II toxin-antitoxin system VapC family toxin [Thermoanaerobaculia bacterium]
MTAAHAYFLDANVLMYAAGSAHPLREPCREALTRAVDQEVSLVTDAEVLQEILHRYFSIGRPKIARVVHRSAIDLCDEVLPIEERHTTRALELLLEHSALTPRDAIHVARMEYRGLEFLLSTDRDFDGLTQLERIDPTSFLLS